MQKAEGLALRLAVLFRLLLLSLPVGCSRSSSMAAGWGSYRRQRRLGRRLLCAHRRMRIRVRADLCFSTPPISIVFLSKSVFAPLIPAIGYRAVLALSGYVLNNNLVFVLAAVYFYKLSNLILKDSKASLLASVLFCFNPASVFYSQYIQRAYMLYLHFVEYSIYFLIQILWQCSCLVYPAQLGQMEQLMPVISVSRHCVRLMMPSPRRELLDMQCRLLLVELQALFACLFHLLFSKLMDTTISVCLLLQMCYHPGASQEFLICMVIFKVITAETTRTVGSSSMQQVVHSAGALINDEGAGDFLDRRMRRAAIFHRANNNKYANMFDASNNDTREGIYLAGASPYSIWNSVLQCSILMAV